MKDFYYLTSQLCFICAAPPSQKVSKKIKMSYIYNGLDRMDCDKGYILGNVHPCCWQHNNLKGNLSYEELYRHSLAVVLSESSKTALDIGDIECLELLIKLFPNVQFIKAHRAALLENIRKKPNELRFNWLCQRAEP